MTPYWDAGVFAGEKSSTITATFWEEDNANGTQFIFVDDYTRTLALTRKITEDQVGVQAAPAPVWPGWLTPVTDQSTSMTFTGPPVPPGWDPSVPFGVPPGWIFFHGATFRKRSGNGSYDALDGSYLVGSRSRYKLWYDNVQEVTIFEEAG